MVPDFPEHVLMGQNVMCALLKVNFYTFSISRHTFFHPIFAYLGNVLRGCQNDLTPSVLAACNDKEDEDTCRKCDYPNCNTGLFPHHRMFCHHCDERQNQGNCSLAIQGTPNPCRKYQPKDKCIVRKHDDHVIRECLSDYEDCNKEKSCKVCDTHGCNNQEYNGGIALKESFIFIAFAFLMTTLFQ